MKLSRLAFLAAMLVGVAAQAQTPEEQLRAAQQLEKEGNVSRAAEAYKAFLAKNPDHSQITEATYRLAKCYDEMGLPDETVATLKKALSGEKKAWRNRPDAWYMLGKLYASLKKYDEAIDTFEKMMGEGAGLYDDEVLNLLGGYYAIQQKYDQAAAKFNILKLRKDSPFAEQAAYKLASLWLRAEKLDLAIAAMQDLAQSFPNNKQIPELLLRAADGYRLKKDYDKTISICEQLKARYPRNIETLAGTYLLGLCYRDRKEFQKAADVLDQVGRVREFQGRGLAAEALLASAEIYYADLSDMDKAMQRYQEAATFARNSDSDRRNQILEQCYFRIGEHYYKQKKYSVALENYLLLRALGTNINILGRILECQKELGISNAAETLTEVDTKRLEERIAANKGTVVALEAEVTLLDRKLQDAMRSRTQTGAVKLAPEYEKLLTAYPKDVLASDNIGAYILSQAGTCYSTGATREELAKAVAAFEKLIAMDPTEKNVYRVPALESIALVAERAGDKPRAMKAYDELFRISKEQLDKAKDDRNLEKKTLDYLRSIVTRPDTDDMINKSIDLCRKIIEEKGVLSELSREARFNMAELYYLKKDYSRAAEVYTEFVKVHGPPLDADGNVKGGPFKPAAGDPVAEQLFEAAIRRAHAWYMQRNDAELKRSYEWIVTNFPHNNKYMAEAQYFLAMELAKGKAGQERDQKRRLADSLWKNVVNPSFEFGSSEFKKSYHPWVRLADDDPSNAALYVKTAILRAGQTYSQINEHELAAGMFEQFLSMFGGGPRHSAKNPRRPAPGGVDEMTAIARYGLGRELIALGRIQKMLEVYQPYLTGQRDDRFRISALKLMGYHAGKAKMWDHAMEAYATLLDEYGEPFKDDKGNEVAVPKAMRLRENPRGWDGRRMPAPKELNLGEIRYALGFLYWKQENYQRCIAALTPFLDDAALKTNTHRPVALFMAAQSNYRLFDYASGVKLLQAIIREYPKYEAIEEVYELAARGYAQTRQWGEVDLLFKKFLTVWPGSPRRPRMELLNAVALLNTGKTDMGLKELKMLVDGEVDQVTKADAFYHQAQHQVASKNDALAMPLFEKSVSLYPRETSCLAGAKCAMRLRNWTRARELLERATREFPQGDPSVVAEARETLPAVLKELAKPK